jgi:hypothetical protein
MKGRRHKRKLKEECEVERVKIIIMASLAYTL